MLDRKIYCISGKGTIWADKCAADEILCLKTIGGLFYCPDLHVLFARRMGFCDEPVSTYNWENAILPSVDETWKDIKQLPYWRTNICRIDAEPLTLSEEEFKEMFV